MQGWKQEYLEGHSTGPIVAAFLETEGYVTEHSSTVSGHAI